MASSTEKKNVSKEIIEAMISLKNRLSKTNGISIQEETNNLSLVEISLDVTNMNNSKNDNLILKLQKKLGSNFLIEIVNLICDLKKLKDGQIKKMSIYEVRG